MKRAQVLVPIGENALPLFGERHREIARLLSGNTLYLDTWRAFEMSSHPYRLQSPRGASTFVTRRDAARLLRLRVRFVRPSLRLMRGGRS